MVWSRRKNGRECLEKHGNEVIKSDLKENVSTYLAKDINAWKSFIE